MTISQEATVRLCLYSQWEMEAAPLVSCFNYQDVPRSNLLYPCSESQHPRSLQWSETAARNRNVIWSSQQRGQHKEARHSNLLDFQPTLERRRISLKPLERLHEVLEKKSKWMLKLGIYVYFFRRHTCRVAEEVSSLHLSIFCPPNFVSTLRSELFLCRGQ